MVNFDANTSQLKAVKNWIDAYCTLDIKNIEPLTSKKFQYHALPGTIDLSKEEKKRHLERYRELFSALAKVAYIYHEVIEAPGKVIAHAPSAVTAIFGDTHPYETVLIITLVEEDVGLDILQCKDFADLQKRSTFIAGVLKAIAERADT